MNIYNRFIYTHHFLNLFPLSSSPMASASKYYFISLGHRLPAGSSRDQRESEATIISPPSSSPLAWLGLLPNRRKARIQNPLLPPPFHAISLQLASFLICLLSFWFWLLHRHMYASLLLRSSIHTCNKLAFLHSSSSRGAGGDWDMRGTARSMRSCS